MKKYDKVYPEVDYKYSTKCFYGNSDFSDAPTYVIERKDVIVVTLEDLEELWDNAYNCGKGDDFYYAISFRDYLKEKGIFLSEPERKEVVNPHTDLPF